MEKDKGCLPFWQGFRVTQLRVEDQAVQIELEP